MSREILFRGKRIDNDEWVEGDLSQRINCRILTKRGCPTLETTTFNHYKVDPETIGQFTGITDKNGVRIFENSCLFDGDSEFYDVKWNHNESGFILWNNNESFSFSDFPDDYFIIIEEKQSQELTN